uniref:DX domain-containing protein n=1 Tax=Caenorhabditis tropicalis TaxID=1561998 RepID=A0A1I7U8V7_9PELO
MAYCDWQLKICCSGLFFRASGCPEGFLEGESPEGYCPNGLTYLGIEKLCSKDTDCLEDAYCYRDHCCPMHNVTGNTVHPLLLPYRLKRKCRPNDAPPFRNTFCQLETNRLAILGEFRIDETENVDTGRICITNQDCPDLAVCVFTSSLGSCFRDPLSSEPGFSFSDPQLIVLMSLIATAFLMYGILLVVHKKKNDEPFWTLLDPSGPFWTLLDPSGPFWTLLDPSGPFWTLLDPSRPFWTLLDPSGPFWTLLDPSGPFWTLLDPSGPFWTLLDPSGPFWTLLDPTGPWYPRIIRIKDVYWRGDKILRCDAMKKSEGILCSFYVFVTVHGKE